MLRHSPPPGSYRHTRYAPPAALAGWLEYFWIESWDLREYEPQVREVLPQPCVHLAFVRGRSRIYGVQLSRFVRMLSGNERVLGAKFRPGAFYPFLRKPLSSISNACIPVNQVFSNVADAEEEIVACHDDRGMVDAASRFLVAHLPALDPNVETVCHVVEEIINDRSLTRLEDVADLCSIRDRTLQRLFHRYVGASARWVVKRYRIYEALEQLAVGKPAEWAMLAQDLGYYDQAHFINDFKKLVGRSPSEYVKI
ncbi:AraC family transcriptional regulator [Rhodanobacter sp. C01]|uniref:helix-turn-helix domain-containing protein n=2 Tax=unclassified Rhodanobacter TaxID=2621553 RepID=UPI0020C55C38|nr:AraC family transcriptional regulator [Rhodanobacter sp. C01]